LLVAVTLPIALPSMVLVPKPQMMRSVPLTRSINTILCVWLT
jgi:hypothetical protein